MSQQLIPLDRLPAVVPEWPISPWSTARLIRLKRLGCVRVGRRVYVTQRLLDEYIAAQTVQPDQHAKAGA